MEKSVFPWQQDRWRDLIAARARLPHAILLHGPAGTGKTQFAEHFAKALLCESPDANGEACAQCAPCGWFDQYSHPDFRRVRPEVLDDADAADGDGVEEKKTTKSAKAPSKDIRVEQIRGLADFINISTHRQGLRVVLLHPVEALNGIAANALLKMLEEPPPSTVFLLVSNSLDRLLPTILSRCRKFPLPMPSRQEALAWLAEQNIVNAEALLAEEGGAPLAASALAQVGARESLDLLLHELARPSTDSALKTAEKLQKAPLPELVTSTQRWLYDVFSVKLSGSVRYYPRYRNELVSLAERAETERLMSVIRLINEQRAVAQHPLSARLFIENMLLDYVALFS